MVQQGAKRVKSWRKFIVINGPAELILGKTLIIEGKMAKKAKNISHEEVSEAMTRFLKKGGVIEKIEYNDNGFLLKNDLALDNSYTEASDSIMSQLHIDFETETRI